MWKNNDWVHSIKSKSHCYLNDGSAGRNAKSTKRYVIKIKIKFEDYESCLKATQIENEKKTSKKMKLMWIVFKRIIKNS